MIDGQLDLALGADKFIDYRSTSFETVVQEVNVVFDTVGDNSRDCSWAVLRKDGRLVTIAADAERLSQSQVRDAFFIVELNQNQLLEISRLMDAGVMKPVVGSLFSMAQFREDYMPGAMSGQASIWFGILICFGRSCGHSIMEGEKPVTYTKGQSWYESPKKSYVVSKNAGQTERTKQNQITSCIEA